jgi:hypothetical protein
MSIYQPQNNNTNANQRLAQDCKRMFTNLKTQHSSAMNVWYRPTVLEELEALGTDALKTFEASYAIQMLFAQLDPSYEFLTPKIKVTVTKTRTVVNEEGEEIEEEYEEEEFVDAEVEFNEDGSFKSLKEKE